MDNNVYSCNKYEEKTLYILLYINNRHVQFYYLAMSNRVDNFFGSIIFHFHIILVLLFTYKLYAH